MFTKASTGDIRKLVQWSPHDDDKFVVSSKQLRLYQVHEREVLAKKQDKRANPVSLRHLTAETDNMARTTVTRKAFQLLNTITVPYSNIRCLDWSPAAGHRNIVSIGVSSGRMAMMRFGEVDGSAVVKEFVPKIARACTSMAYNKRRPNQVAVGLVRVRDGCGCLVWDVNAKGNKVHDFSSTIESLNTFDANDVSQFDSVNQPVSYLANSEAALAVSWLPNDASAIAVGTGHKWLRVYDTRGNFRPLSVFAHPKGVYGVKFDPLMPFRLATFSEDNLIKLWDMRMIKSRNTPLMTISTFERGKKSRKLRSIDWCPTRPGYLASLSQDSDEIRLWDLSTQATRIDADVSNTTNHNKFFGNNNSKVHVSPSSRRHRSENNDTIVKLSWHPKHKQRLVSITAKGLVEDVALHESIPLDFSCNNTLSFAMLGYLYTDKNQQTDKKLSVFAGDIATIMNTRAKEGYRLDASENERWHRNAGMHTLADTWNLVHHFEVMWKFMPPVPATKGKSPPQQSPSIYSGITVLLNGQPSRAVKLPIATAAADAAVATSDHKQQPALQNASAALTNINLADYLTTYTSPERKNALLLCRWWNYADLEAPAQAEQGRQASVHEINFENALLNLEAKGQFEKACAVALFHLDLDRALLCMQKASTNVSKKKLRRAPVAAKERNANFELMCMALSGYATVLREQSSRVMWRETIQKTVLTRLTNPYMRACLVFLGSLTDQNDSAEERLGMNLYRTILFEKEIDLAVRAAFALSFLNDEDLYVFTQNVTNVCSRNGYLEGLLLTGLNTSAGVAILQSHLNRTGDVQTVALLSCYFQGVVDNADDLKTLENWIDTYKDLLNRWRMFETRAHFQIARKELLHSIADQTGLESARAAARVRPQVVARCTFCGGSLSLKNLSTSSRPGGQFSSRGAKTKITLGQASSTVANTRVRGCPRCKKVLPRCSICLVTLDVAVPKARQSSQSLLQRGGRNAPSDKKTKLLLSPEHNSHVHKSKADSSSHAFGQWFTWCQKCRHGGHAGHIDEWFQDHKTCPVTNCDCACNTLDYLG